MTIGTEIERGITEEIGINTANQTIVAIRVTIITTATTTAVVTIIPRREGLRTGHKRDRRTRVLGSELLSL